MKRILVFSLVAMLLGAGQSLAEQKVDFSDFAATFCKEGETKKVETADCTVLTLKCVAVPGVTPVGEGAWVIVKIDNIECPPTPYEGADILNLR